MHQKPFSKLKKPLEALFVPELKMKFFSNAFTFKNPWGSMNTIPRFYLVMDKEILWDFPANFEVKNVGYGWWADRNNISNLIREYIDTPVEELLNKKFDNETLFINPNWHPTMQKPEIEINYHLTELFIAADRRIGKEKLNAFAALKNNPVVDRILNQRLSPGF